MNNPHTILEFPSYRNVLTDVLYYGIRKHQNPIFIEIDVTKARQKMKERKTKTGEGISFTAWATYCISKAVTEHKHVHALRKGKHKVVIFDEVHINIVIEREIKKVGDYSETLPMSFLIKRTNERSLTEIQSEIRKAQTIEFPEGEVQLGLDRSPLIPKVFNALPKFLRYLILFRRLNKDPFFFKSTLGTVNVSSIGSVGSSEGAMWAIPIGLHPLSIVLGNISQQPAIINEKIEPREFLHMTVKFDHNVTDGAPMIRFIERLKELMETGYGIDD